MQIVIEISKKLYDRYKEKDHIKRCDIDEWEKAIDGCTILPKGHGDLIDRSQILTVTDFREDGTERCYVPYVHIEEAETIIEADGR